jgi:hypothetical protein
MLAVGYALRPLANFDQPLVWRVWRRLHSFTYQCQMSHNMFAQIHLVPITRFEYHIVSMSSLSADQVSDAIGSGWETDSNERTTSKVKCISSISHDRRFWPFSLTYYGLSPTDFVSSLPYTSHLQHHTSIIHSHYHHASTHSIPALPQRSHHIYSSSPHTLELLPSTPYTHSIPALPQRSNHISSSSPYTLLHHTHTASKPSNNNGIPAEHLLDHLLQHSHRRPRESPSMALPHVLRRVCRPPPPPSLVGRLPAEVLRAGGPAIGANGCRAFCPGGVGVGALV